MVSARVAVGRVWNTGCTSDLRHAHRSQRGRRFRRNAGRVRRARRGLHRLDHQAARRGHLPRRHRARLRSGEEQHRCMARALPGADPAAAAFRVPADHRRHGPRRPDTHGHHRRALAVLPLLPLLHRTRRNHGPGPARRHRDLRQEPDRHRALRARGLAGERLPLHYAEPGLLGHRRGGQPAPVPRRGHLQAFPRALNPHQLASGNRVERAAHHHRRGGRDPRG